MTYTSPMQDYLVATLMSFMLIAVCVTIHYEALIQLERLRARLQRHRWIILFTVHGLILAHIAEIWIFGLGYFAAEHGLGLGEIVAADRDWFDYIYYSAMVYTTVGFGDLVPTGPLRMITATEALAGLSLITWSASFTFLQMQRIWRV
ncbi:MAG: potassium channel family protein [Woeseia sp.]